MDEEERFLAEARKEVSYWQQRMPLIRSYRIDVQLAEEGATPYGCRIDYSRFAKEATILIERNLRLGDPSRDTVRWFVTHELVHLMLETYTGFISSLARDDQVRQILINSEEELVWSLTDLLLALREHGDEAYPDHG